MKQFDDYWKENWNEYEWAGCERAGRLCYEDGVKTGMLAAADIAESDLSDFAKSLINDDDDWNNCCEEIAKAIREAAE